MFLFLLHHSFPVTHTVSMYKAVLLPFSSPPTIPTAMDSTTLLLFLLLTVFHLRADAADLAQLQHLKSTHLIGRRHHFFAAISPPSQNNNHLQVKTGVVVVASPRVYHVTSYGADPSGTTDSTEALISAISDAVSGPSHGYLMPGIINLGGAEINLDGGTFKISSPLRFPFSGIGNVLIHGGTLMASDTFPSDGYLIDLSHTETNSQSSYSHEFITLRGLMLDCNYRGGGITVTNSLRTGVDNCYIVHYSTIGIAVKAGHETMIRNSFLGQHITAGADPGERNFSGTGISLAGNDNAVTDVVIFSAAIGVMVSGEANVLTGVHCYNKAHGFGGVGIYLKLAGLTQTRVVNCYMDYTGIVAEDPVQLLVSGCFFLGDAFVTLRSVEGKAKGVSVVDNMFAGSGSGVEIVQLDESKGKRFKEIEEVVVDRNSVKGMKMKTTRARGTAEGSGRRWSVDFGSMLLFPNLMREVQYSLRTTGAIPRHAMREVAENVVVVETDMEVAARVYVSVDQTP